MTDNRIDERTRPRSNTDAPTLLGEDYEAFGAALSGESGGPIAVVGDPFSGRETVLDRAEQDLDATRITLGPGEGFDRIQSESNGDPLVIENCQHLYERRIGGFRELSSFLDHLVGIERTVVAGWNRYAWSYLAAVQGLDREFPVTVEIQPLPVERIAELVLGRYEEMPEFVADEPEHGGIVVTKHHEFGWRDRSISVPLPMLSPVAIKALFSGGDLDPRDVSFGRLAAVSNGNIGVASAIWETNLGAAVRPSDITGLTSDRDLDREEAFCLRIVLANERIDRTQLSEVVDGLDRILGRLSRDGLVTVENGIVELVPGALPGVTEATERSMIL